MVMVKTNAEEWIDALGLMNGESAIHLNGPGRIVNSEWMIIIIIIPEYNYLFVFWLFYPKVSLFVVFSICLFVLSIE